jgi:F-type H+-transporting ATPase subunit b
MKKLALALSLAASPAFAAGDMPFFSLYNTNFVVLLAFLLFIAVLVYVKVPAKLGGALDARAESIKADLNEAKALREEAQTVLASYERKQKEVKDQAERIIEHAKTEAAMAAEQAKADLKASIKRRLAAAEDQIASAQAAAVKDVRDRAIQIAVAAASDVIAANMTAADGNALVDDAIKAVGEKLH